ncbi:hypothetical protein GUITHDRAFT_132349 [Guillardia theta CCMP2712]|uniref:Methyltransferase domain-containing protein n=1 Tax=Guillardia theta (strain CCMP2712) TaxID=905079 RepID=L1K262_GUITC|nr:hypothetical protein GUITHDRAFT_132349 [Guillardia theta CCMP2712]EKX54669.1 hypothetical protein GUITHDRAFT_132349 [Guillardia theta CCMP2712]|eukprot:XP_005841649.1 hypothetical protein GUITHDRAFT_132349 [Guillardia theta CCMP2712]
MAPRNSGSRRLKARRTRIRQRYFDQIVEILPTLASNSTSLSWADGLLPQGGVAVDFCGGSGHLGLVLATLRSDATIYIVEKKGAHCDIAQKRSDLMGLKNVKVKNLEVSEFHEAFDVGLGLHACGASYVLAPCCYGFISKALDKYKLEYVDKNTNADMCYLADPVRSQASLAGTPALGGYFFVRGRDTDPQRMLKVRARVYLQAKEQEEREGSADGTFWPTEYSFTEQRENFARSCMFAVDLDRSLAAEETGYLATMTSMCDGDIDAAGQKNQTGFKRWSRIPRCRWVHQCILEQYPGGRSGRNDTRMRTHSIDSVEVAGMANRVIGGATKRRMATGPVAAIDVSDKGS